MTLFVLGLGMALVIEGLVLALAPSRLDALVALVASLSRDQRRIMGLVALGLGVVLVLVARAFGV